MGDLSPWVPDSSCPHGSQMLPPPNTASSLLFVVLGLIHRDPTRLTAAECSGAQTSPSSLAWLLDPRPSQGLVWVLSTWSSPERRRSQPTPQVVPHGNPGLHLPHPRPVLLQGPWTSGSSVGVGGSVSCGFLASASNGYIIKFQPGSLCPSRNRCSSSGHHTFAPHRPEGKSLQPLPINTCPRSQAHRAPPPPGQEHASQCLA